MVSITYKHSTNTHMLHIWGKDFTIHTRLHYKFKNNIEFEWSEMYEAPQISFAMLTELSEFFGTKEIDVDNSINSPGCETCDYGSSYGHVITVYNITQNYPSGD